MHLLRDIAIVGAVGLGAYELYHLHQYGTLGFGNPYNQGYGGYTGYGDAYAYGTQMGYPTMTAPPPPPTHHHHHHHQMM